jgi:hypothetical protein
MKVPIVTGGMDAARCDGFVNGTRLLLKMVWFACRQIEGDLAVIARSAATKRSSLRGSGLLRLACNGGCARVGEMVNPYRQNPVS